MRGGLPACCISHFAPFASEIKAVKVWAHALDQVLCKIRELPCCNNMQGIFAYSDGGYLAVIGEGSSNPTMGGINEVVSMV